MQTYTERHTDITQMQTAQTLTTHADTDAAMQTPIEAHTDTSQMQTQMQTATQPQMQTKILYRCWH